MKTSKSAAGHLWRGTRDVGTQGYFEQINIYTVLERVMPRHREHQYDTVLSYFAFKARDAADRTLSDLRQHARYLRFCPEDSRERLKNALQSLERLCSLSGNALRDADACCRLLALDDENCRGRELRDSAAYKTAYDIYRYGAGGFALTRRASAILEQAVYRETLDDAYYFSEGEISFCPRPLWAGASAL